MAIKIKMNRKLFMNEWENDYKTRLHLFFVNLAGVLFKIVFFTDVLMFVVITQ